MEYIAIGVIGVLIFIATGLITENRFIKVEDGLLADGYDFKIEVTRYLRCSLVCIDSNCGSFAFSRSTGDCFVYSQTYNANSTSNSYPGLRTFTRRGICAGVSYTPFVDLGLCLKGYDAMVTWPAAKLQCELDGGQLLLMKDFNRIEKEVSKLSLPSSFYWIGARSVGENWTWEDGTPAAHFADRNDLDAPADQCLGFLPSSKNLHILLCDTNNMPFICEMTFWA